MTNEVHVERVKGIGRTQVLKDIVGLIGADPGTDQSKPAGNAMYMCVYRESGPGKGK